MPWSARSPCKCPGCANLAERNSSYCADHADMGAKAAKWGDKARGSAHERGYTSKWRVARTAYLARHPLCAQCAQSGQLEAATVVDHIVPHRGDMRLFWDQSNWQPLCKSCHDKKTFSGR